MQAFPAIKWFSGTDQSRTFPTPVQCIRVDKPVNAGWRTWANWAKVMQLLEGEL
jgi:hypothetical protein